METDSKEEIINNESLDIQIPEEEKEESDNEGKKSLDDDDNIEIDVMNDDDGAATKRNRKKRRTKDEIQGRDHICSLCQRAYLSYPALTNHRKTKHSSVDFHRQIVTDDKKRRGRPKKNIYVNFLAEYETKIKNFYDDESRKNITDNSLEIQASIECLLEKNPKLDRELSTKFLNDLVNMNNENLPCKDPPSIDEAFIKFIIYSHKKISDNYFLFVLKFILYFRKSITCSSDVNIFTDITSANSIPDYANNFFIYMNENKFFDLTSDEDRLELVSLIEYTCLWLKENGYSKSKLNLI